MLFRSQTLVERLHPAGETILRLALDDLQHCAVEADAGAPRTVSPSEARSDLAEGVVDAEGAAAPFNRQDPSLWDRIIL